MFDRPAPRASAFPEADLAGNGRLRLRPDTQPLQPKRSLHEGVTGVPVGQLRQAERAADKRFLTCLPAVYPGRASGSANMKRLEAVFLYLSSKVKNMLPVRIALFGAFMFVAPVMASAADQDFTVRNKTGYQIDNIYVSPHSNRSWGDDVMGRGVVLEDDQTLDISFPHTASACHFDLMVAYNDGDKATWDDLNLCEISTVTLHYDRKAGTTRATTE